MQTNVLGGDMKKETYICDLCKSEFEYNPENFKVVQWGGINLNLRAKNLFLKLKRFTLEKFVKFDVHFDEYGELTKIQDICADCSDDIENYILGKINER